MNDEDLQAQQREAQRLLGRCLLRLQQYERLMKGIVAHHDILGPAHELESIRAARVHEASTNTLGTLVGRLFGSCIVTEGADTAADDTANEPVDVIHFAMRMQLSLSAENYDRIQSDLRELVQLRNNLVHHFIDQHDLWSIDGCRAAHGALVAACEHIGKHFEQLRGWARHLDQLRQLSAEFLQSDDGYDLMVNGIFPDGTVNWPAFALRGLDHRLVHRC